MLNLSLFGKVKVVGWVTIKSYNSDFDKLDSIIFWTRNHFILVILQFYIQVGQLHSSKIGGEATYQISLLDPFKVNFAF